MRYKISTLMASIMLSDSSKEVEMPRSGFCRAVFMFLGACVVFTGSVAAGQGGGWSPKGPEGGSIRKVDVLANGDVLASTKGGVYKSTNNGDSWTRLATGLVPISVTATTVHPSGTLFAATSDLLQNGTVFRSTNGGATWSPSGSGLPPGHILTLTTSPTGTLFAGTFIGRLYRSTDSGNSWVASDQGMSVSRIYDVGIDITGTTFAGTSDGAYESTNGGVNWIRRSNGLPSGARVYDIAFSQNGEPLAGTSHGLYKYNTGTQSWTEFTTLPGADTFGIAVGSNGNFYALVLFSGMWRVYSSSNSGQSWSEMASFFENVNSIAVKDGDVFLGTEYDGVRRSHNGGPFQIINNGLIATSVTSLGKSGSTMLAAVGGGRIYLSPDLGASWQRTVDSLLWLATIKDLKAGGLGNSVAVGRDSSGPRVFVLPASGSAWENRSIGGSGSVLGVAINQNTVVTMGENGGYFSSNSGATFQPSVPPMFGTDVVWNNVMNMYIGANFMGTLHTSFDGMVWGPPFATTLANRIDVDVSSGMMAVATAFPRVELVSTSGTVTPLTNQWQTSWYPTDVSFDGHLCSSYSNLSSPLVTGIVTWNGTSWVDRGWTNAVNIEALVHVDSSSSVTSLFAATNGAGVWRLDIATDVELEGPELPGEFALYQNNPNPFNPSTAISYQLPTQSPAVLKVYDILGREVATLVNEVRDRGRYEVTFDASGLASGVYLYRLQAGAFTETKKLILLR